MNFEPQKIFIGLIDFFSILMPGALLTGVLFLAFYDQSNLVALSIQVSNVAGSGGWAAAFLFVSYLLGHLVFLLGSWLDEFYGWARRYTLDKQISLLARRDRLLPWLARAMIWLIFKDERDLAVNQASRIKRRALKSLGAENSINTFQWCKALLNVESPASLASVQRLEADSKFFRSFTVVLFIILPIWLLGRIICPSQVKSEIQNYQIFLLLLLWAAFLLLALWRYMEQRFKATNQAYWSVITLTARGDKVPNGKEESVAGCSKADINATTRQPACSEASVVGTPTHAGGVVFRRRAGEAQYLLVEAKDDPDQWVLPKGHVEELEDYRETAVREVREETGVWASIGVLNPPPPGCVLRRIDETVRSSRRISPDLGNVSYSVNTKPVIVRVYLMEAVGCGLREDKIRQHLWLPLQKAVGKASHPETRELLRSADQRRCVAECLNRAVWRLKGHRLADRLQAITALDQICVKFPDLSDPAIHLLTNYLTKNTVDYGVAEPPSDVREIISVFKRSLGAQELCGTATEPTNDRITIDLRNAFIRRTSLANVNLEGADFSGADCMNVEFQGANMKNTRLEGTILRGADLTGVRNLTRAQIALAIVDEHTILPTLEN